MSSDYSKFIKRSRLKTGNFSKSSLIISSLGLLLLLVITFTLPFNSGLFSKIFIKPYSHATASSTSIVLASPINFTSTFNSIGIEGFYSGDSDVNATIIPQFRVTGTSTWRDALPLWKLSAGTLLPSQPAFYGSIVQLNPGTSYDVQLVINDPDGVTSPSALTATSTLYLNNAINTISSATSGSGLTTSVSSYTNQDKYCSTPPCTEILVSGIQTREDKISNLYDSNGNLTLTPNYYVSPSGNDANNGTSDSAAFLTIEHAVQTALPGSVIQVDPGHYNTLPLSEIDLNNNVTLVAKHAAVNDSQQVINAGSHSILEEDTVTSPNTNVWQQVTLTGPNTGQPYTVWKYSLPSTGGGSVTYIGYASSQDSSPTRIPIWKAVPSNETPAHFAEKLYQNNSNNYGAWIDPSNNLDIYLRMNWDANQNPNTYYMTISRTANSNGTGFVSINGNNVRLAGFEVRNRGIYISPGVTGTIFDHNYFGVEKASLYFAGNGQPTNTLYPSDVVVQHNLFQDSSQWSVNPSTQYVISWNWLKGGFCDCAASSSAALSAGGSVDPGNHHYQTTFVYQNGFEGNQSYTSNTITPISGNQTVSLSNIPLGGAGVVARKIYRTKAGGSTYYYLTTLNDNTTTTYLDTTPDSSLTSVSVVTNPYDADSHDGEANESTPIFGNGAKRLVIRDNTFDQHWDAVSTYCSSCDQYTFQDFDFYNNTVEHNPDDGIEVSGESTLNWRIWDNMFEYTGTVFSSSSPGIIYGGPIYIFRNTGWRIGAAGIGKPSGGMDGTFFKISQRELWQPLLYIINNTFWSDDATNGFVGSNSTKGYWQQNATDGGCICTTGTSSNGYIVDGFYMRNNIFSTTLKAFEEGASTPTNGTGEALNYNEDYNWFYTSNSDQGLEYLGTHYTSLNNYQQASSMGQHDNLINGTPVTNFSSQPPSLTNPANGDLSLSSSSPQIDAGTPVPNIADLPGVNYFGAAPDLGATETGSSITPTPTPTLTPTPTATPSPTSSPTSKPSSCPTKTGDFNNDGSVNLTDLSIFAASYGTTSPNIPNPCTDLNSDGSVNLTDLSLFAAVYGT